MGWDCGGGVKSVNDNKATIKLSGNGTRNRNPDRMKPNIVSSVPSMFPGQLLDNT